MTILITRRESLHLPDGINAFLFALSDGLIQRGHRVVAVSTCQVRREIVEQTFHCETYPELTQLTNEKQISYFETGLTWFRLGRRHLRPFSPDISIINGILPVKLPGANIAVSHDIEQRFPKWNRLRVFYKRLFYRLNDQIIATCTEVAHALAAELRIDHSAIEVIPTCIPPGRYPIVPIQQRKLLILHMGTADYKNPLTTVKAFIRLNHPAATLHITGPLTDSLAAFLDTIPAPCRNRIIAGSFVSADELQSLLGRARVVSIPSSYSVPVASPTVLESFAAGAPVVCSSSISRDIIGHQKNAIVANSADAMAQAFEQLLTSETAWQSMSINGLETARRFSSHEVAGRYERLAQRLTSRSAVR